MSEMDLTMDYDELTEEHLKAIKKGGAHGRERLVGSVIKTGATKLQIFCVESYSKNCLEDPHAEPATLNPSSTPNNSRMTQYRGRLKITVLWDGYGKPRLIIGLPLKTTSAQPPSTERDAANFQSVILQPSPSKRSDTIQLSLMKTFSDLPKYDRISGTEPRTQLGEQD
ncbi:hypothetical protein BGZ65_007608 [Modicella reniformis]|uniref:Uncharacterized protein n=1 Tax=Modicella reniformis TaxID=1440133 RepID=A0A9P6MF40_9FUNG|nr:hypothetical protein BGZ65_007608 [Modicella reniformis]